MKWKLLVTVVVLFGVLGMASLGTLTQEHGGTLIAGIHSDPIGFDPHTTSAYSSFEVLENVYDTLVELSYNLLPQPALATSWVVSENGLTWTFLIRSGVKFHNGRSLTAEDVKYSLERIMDPETGSGNAWRLAAVESIETFGDQVVAIHLKHPYPALVAKIAYGKPIAIVAKENVEDGTINTHPIGTGPFEFVEHIPGNRIVLKRNPNYWREGKPYLEQLIYRPIPDEIVRVTSLLTGDIDWLDTVPPQRISELKGNENLVVGEVDGMSYWYIGVNCMREPMSDKRVRQAIAYAIDRAEITAAAKWEAATPSDNPLPEGSYWNAGYHPYLGHESLEKAGELLAEAGYADGFKADVMVSTQFPETVRAAQVLQAQLQALGIELEIRVLEWGTWLEEEAAGNFDFYICGWISNLSPDDYFYAQHYTDEVFNFTGYSNTELDELLDQGRREADPEKRFEIYAQVQRIIIDDAPYIYLYIPKVVHAWLPHVKGYVARPDERIRFLDTWVEK